MIEKWVHKYERKPGRWVFEPTEEYRDIGKKVKQAVNSVWLPPYYYFHLRDGGHVKALTLHAKNTYFVRFDIEDFFGRVSRTRATRCLKEFFPYADAKKMAEDSTVRHPVDKGRRVIPYGFVQSPILASLALSKSKLGKALHVLNKTKGIDVSVYVDDIILSGNDVNQLQDAADGLTSAAVKSLFDFNADKSQGPAKAITAFNVELTHKSLAILKERMEEFALDLNGAAVNKRNGILSYVKSINADQEKQLSA